MMKANQCLYTPTDWNRECEKALGKLKGHIDFYTDVLITSEHYKLHVIEEMKWEGMQYTSPSMLHHYENDIWDYNNKKLDDAEFSKLKLSLSKVIGKVIISSTLDEDSPNISKLWEDSDKHGGLYRIFRPTTYKDR